MESILTEEECRKVGEAKAWWHSKLALTVAVKPSAVVEHTLDVLKEYKEEWWYSKAANDIKGLHAFPYTVLEMNNMICLLDPGM